MFHKPFPSEIKEEKHGTKRKHEPSRRGKECAEAEQLLVFDTGVDQKIVAAERPMNPAPTGGANCTISFARWTLLRMCSEFKIRSSILFIFRKNLFIININF